MRRPLIPEQCKQRVYRDGWGSSQCQRNHKRDGYCNQHHPDAVQKRRDDAQARYEEANRASKARSDARREAAREPDLKQIAALYQRIKKLEHERDVARNKLNSVRCCCCACGICKSVIS